MKENIPTNKVKEDYSVIYIGPLVIHKVIYKFHYTLLDIEGKILNNIFHFNRLKQAILKTTKGLVRTMADLKQSKFRD